MHRLGVEQRPDNSQGIVQVAVAAPVDRRGARRRSVKTEDHAHRGGLAGTVGSEEAGHDAGADLDAQVVDGGDGAEPLRQLIQFDHAAPRETFYPPPTNALQPTAIITPDWTREFS